MFDIKWRFYIRKYFKLKLNVSFLVRKISKTFSFTDRYEHAVPVPSCPTNKRYSGPSPNRKSFHCSNAVVPSAAVTLKRNVDVDWSAISLMTFNPVNVMFIALKVYDSSTYFRIKNLYDKISDLKIKVLEFWTKILKQNIPLTKTANGSKQLLCQVMSLHFCIWLLTHVYVTYGLDALNPEYSTSDPLYRLLIS